MRTPTIAFASTLGAILLFGTNVLTISPGCFGQVHGGTGMIMLEQPDSPAILIETHHTTKDLLQSAKLKNIGKRLVTSYRVGWVVVYPSGRNKVGLGLPIDVPAGIRPGEIANVPAQTVSLDFAKEGGSAVVFFVTDVYSAGGPTWKPDLDKIEQKARQMERADRNAR